MEKMYSLDGISRNLEFCRNTMEENVKISHKPFKDWICPKCRHNVGYKQNYCNICGLKLEWDEEITVYPTYPVYPTWRDSTAYPITTTTIITC